MTALEKFNEEQRKLRSVRGSEAKLAGIQFEAKVAAHQRKCSEIAFRNHTDHGFADVVAVKKDGTVWYISCKKNAYWHPDEVKELEKRKESFAKMQGKHIIKMAYYKNQKQWTMGTF